MDSLWNTVDVNHNIVRLLHGREANGGGHGRCVQHCCQFTAGLLQRMHLEHNLEGHAGCVNCLEWSANGQQLASGSDDTVVRIWDPFANRCLHVLPTKHIGNIFSVKFVGDGSILATCAGDCRVIVQSIVDSAKQAIMDCSCHTARVKRLATAPDCPALFWSAGEDGLILQYDLREPHECTKNATAFLDLYTSEFKCIAVNPTKPHLIAVGANDAYVRLYDRRYVKTSKITVNAALPSRKRTPSEPQDPNCVQYFSPGHLAHDHLGAANFRLVATYVAFDAAGNDLLVNMGGDHIYLYDVNNARSMDELLRPDWLPKLAPPPPAAANSSQTKLCCSGADNILYTPPKDADDGHKHNYRLAAAENACACEYIARARRLLRRRYIGDVYFAARDFLAVIKLWPQNVAGYLGLIECLIELKWPTEAQTWLAYVQEKFASGGGVAVSVDKQVRRMGEEVKKMKEAPTVEAEGVERLDEGLDADVSPVERALRLESWDYAARYLGHCNTTTDIKEANFLGHDGNFICAGSDDGMIFFWDRKTTNLLTALVADASIVNCVQPHPTTCYIASSGIDSGVKIWSPMNEDADNFKNLCAVKDLWIEVEGNQERMAMDPFDTLIMSMGMGFRDIRTTRSATGEVQHSTCRTC